MGFDEGRIVFDSVNGAYYPGQTVYGRLEFDQNSVKTFRGIYADFKGYCKVHWTKDRTRRENDRDISYTVTHESHEEYFYRRVYLIGGKNGEHHIQPGHHSFPFQCQIPQNCPSSFEGSNGHIRYSVKVVVDRAFKFDQEKHASIRVIAPLNLNDIPICREPIQMELINSFCCFCFSSGNAQTLIKLPVSGYCPGQVMPIEVSCKNNSNVEIDSIRFTLGKEITYHAESEPDTRSDSDVLAQIKKGPVPGGTTRNYTLEMEVPAIDVLNLNSCKFIVVQYEFRVEVEVSGCHNDSEDANRIFIGSIPLQGFQDDVENPLKDQMPNQPVDNVQTIQGVTSTYPLPPTINQPLPTISPYPVVNQIVNNGLPYPGGNPPYLGGSPPVPGGNPPYPGGNPPYPGGNPPYPGGSSPYTSSKPFYPGGNPPYSGANPPYPGGNPPYPGGNPPYTGTNPPYPGGNPPYSGGNPPLPGSNLNSTGTTLLKTGNIGFTVQSHEPDSTIPLLPSTAAIPYPANPFASASAPAPFTQDK